MPTHTLRTPSGTCTVHAQLASGILPPLRHTYRNIPDGRTADRSLRIHPRSYEKMIKGTAEKKSQSKGTRDVSSRFPSNGETDGDGWRWKVRDREEQHTHTSISPNPSPFLARDDTCAIPRRKEVGRRRVQPTRAWTRHVGAHVCVSDVRC